MNFESMCVLTNAQTRFAIAVFVGSSGTSALSHRTSVSPGDGSFVRLPGRSMIFTSRAAAESYSEFRWTWWEGDVCLLLILLDLVGRGRLSTFLPYLPIFVVNKSIY